MLIETARWVQPTHVVELRTLNAHRNLPPEGSWLPAYSGGPTVNPAFLCGLPALEQSSQLAVVCRPTHPLHGACAVCICVVHATRMLPV